VLSQAIADLAAPAVAVALSPIPIIAVVVVLSTARARTNGPAFALGWVIGLTAVTTVVVVVAGGASDPDSTSSTAVGWLKVGIGVLFLVLAGRQWHTRPRPGDEPSVPSWMAHLDVMSAPRALGLGLVASGANPKNLALSLAAGAVIAAADLDGGDATIAVAFFVALGSVTVVGSVAFYFLAGRRAGPPLEALKRFMTDNNATIMMVLLLVLGVMVLGDGLSALWS
jgi:threonine/homoserine/homoserine lactone efflux protein